MGGTACCVTKKHDVMVEMDNNRKKKSGKSHEKQLVAGVGAGGDMAAATVGAPDQSTTETREESRDAFGSIDVDGVSKNQLPQSIGDDDDRKKGRGTYAVRKTLAEAEEMAKEMTGLGEESAK